MKYIINDSFDNDRKHVVCNAVSMQQLWFGSFMTHSFVNQHTFKWTLNFSQQQTFKWISLEAFSLKLIVRKTYIKLVILSGVQRTSTLAPPPSLYTDISHIIEYLFRVWVKYAMHSLILSTLSCSFDFRIDAPGDVVSATVRMRSRWALSFFLSHSL